LKNLYKKDKGLKNNFCIIFFFKAKFGKVKKYIIIEKGKKKYIYKV